jgi:bifunctional UDP-N-acetylglucosamine pyrophosphorylase/glucosamine-1-phosphate N-acetyltransferase
LKKTEKNEKIFAVKLEGEKRMQYIAAIILAAGEGKRMKSKNSKVVHKICGKPLVKWVDRAAKEAGISDSIIVVGHKAEQVKEAMGEEVDFVLQAEQLGTGHAVMQCESFLKGKNGTVMVLCGDTPLLSSETLAETLKYHHKNNYAATVITSEVGDPTGYGRIIRNSADDIVKIVEQKDATEEEKKINEINSGMYCFDIEKLLGALSKLGNNNNQGEYYLPDTLEILISEGQKVGAYKTLNSDDILGINDKVQLYAAEQIMKKRINEGLMRNGVIIIDPNTSYIDADAKIGRDTVIYPNTIIEGETEIGEDCVIGPNSRIVDSFIDEGAEVANSVVLQSKIGHKTKVGPFAYIRPESNIGSKVKIGDFVEVKKSKVGDNTKISHLTYVGDAEVGKNVNLGCGVVFVNYDGKKKHKTVVEDDCFIGCNTNLVSPVVVKKGAYIAAGSTITEEVPENSLAIARCRQTVKEDWVLKKGKQKD